MDPGSQGIAGDGLGAEAGAALSRVIAPVAGDAAPAGEAIGRLLRAIRTHLGMDVAFVAEFSDGRRYFRHVDAKNPDSPVRAGASDPLEESYCQRVVDGRLPYLMGDASQFAEARTLPVTAALPVGAHVSVPIRLSNGHVYGTFCCFSSRPDSTLAPRDVEMMRVFAQVAGDYLEQEHAEDIRRHEVGERIANAMRDGAISSVYQPIYRVGDHRVAGFEALTRFDTSPLRPPDVWFNEASSAGLSEVLESAAIRSALSALQSLPSTVYVSVNVSPEFVMSGGLTAALRDQPLDRILLEVTEHAAITSYDEIAAALKPFRDRGMHVAVDDAGAGYASFRHILKLQPDVIKLDVSITREVDRDPIRRSLAAALIGFATRTGSRAIAEGVETAEELSALRELGVTGVQGYYLGRPMTLSAAVQLLADRAVSPTTTSAPTGTAADADATPWHRMVLSDRQIARLDALRLQSYFEAIWLSESSPPEAALFTEARLTRGEHRFYLTPGAAQIFLPFLRAHTGFRAAPCSAPAVSAVAFVAGDPEAAWNRLEPEESRPPE